MPYAYLSWLMVRSNWPNAAALCALALLPLALLVG
jgi:hypothetical protein